MNRIIKIYIAETVIRLRRTNTNNSSTHFVATLCCILALFASATNANAQGMPLKSYGTMIPDSIPFLYYPAYPAKVRMAIVIGTPAKPEPYVVRVKVPYNVKVMPHTHPEDRVYTVISGVFYIGLGKVFDTSKLVAYPPGSVVVLPANTPHFHWAKSGEYVTQISGVGPLGINYINDSDDPRKKK